MLFCPLRSWPNCRSFDFEAQEGWRAYRLNLEIPPGKEALLDKFRAKWYKREIVSWEGFAVAWLSVELVDLVIRIGALKLRGCGCINNVCGGVAGHRFGPRLFPNPLPSNHNAQLASSPLPPPLDPPPWFRILSLMWTL